MRRVLLFFLLFLASFVGKAQVVLNEIYITPGSREQEFFELYNTNPQAEKLDCYTLVIYYKTANNNSERGFIILNLPDVTIPEFGYVTGASTNPFSVQSSTNVTPTFSWNNLGTTGYLRNYQVNNNLTSYNPNAAITDLNDIFRKYHTGELAVYLFKENKYVNGLQVGFGTESTVIAEVKEMPNLTGIPITGTNCSATTFDINWKTIQVGVETATGGASGGNNNGYARQFDGNCGSWAKTSNSSNHTPGRPNTSGITVSSSGTISTFESLVCNGTTALFRVNSTNEPSVFPLNVEMYYDLNNNNTIDAGEYQSAVPVQSASTTKNYEFSVSPANQKVILVYRTALGCISKIVPLSNPDFNLAANESICQRTVNFSLIGTVSDSAFRYPVQVSIYKAADAEAGNFDNPLYTTSINAPAPASATATGSIVMDAAKAPLYAMLAVVYKPAYNCSGNILATKYFTVTSSDLETKEYLQYDPTTVNFQVISETYNAPSSPVFPLKVEIYADNTSNTAGSVVGQFDDTDPLLKTYTINDFMNNEISYVLPSTYQYSSIFVFYRKPANCLNEVVRIANVLPVTFSSFTVTRNKTNKHQVDIAWETSFEQNNKGFYLQRKTDGEWQDIGFVFSAANGGNSHVSLRYRFKDLNTFRGISYYRMYQMDLDGKADYSEVKALMGENSGSGVLVYPNPAHGGKTTLLFPDTASRNIMLNDGAGRMLQQYRNHTAKTLTMERLKPGFYTVQIVEALTGKQVVEKIIVQ